MKKNEIIMQVGHRYSMGSPIFFDVEEILLPVP